MTNLYHPQGGVILKPRGWRVAMFCTGGAGIVVVDVLADSEADAKGVAERMAIEKRLVKKVSSIIAQKHTDLSAEALMTAPPQY
jgi:hypothetical protein